MDGSRGEREEDTEHEEHANDYKALAVMMGDGHLALRPSLQKRENSLGTLKAPSEQVGQRRRKRGFGPQVKPR